MKRELKDPWSFQRTFKLEVNVLISYFIRKYIKKSFNKRSEIHG